MNKVCRECPFSRSALSGWLGDYESAEHFARVHIDADEVNPCHMTVDYEDPEWKAGVESGEMGHACVGQQKFYRNNCKSPWRPGIEPSDSYDPAVFNWRHELVAHHDGESSVGVVHPRAKEG